MERKNELEIISMNDELYSEFTITELEQRLETDPLMLADLMLSLSCPNTYCSGGYGSSGGTCNSVFCSSQFIE